MPKTIRLNATYHFIIKIPNTKEVQQKAVLILSLMIFFKFCKDYTKEPFLCVVKATALP